MQAIIPPPHKYSALIIFISFRFDLKTIIEPVF